MGIFDRFRGRKHVVDVKGKKNIDAQTRAASTLRRRKANGDEGTNPKRGMWVRFDDGSSGRTGVLKDIEPGDIATVMLVDEQGLNLLEIHCHAAQLRQAHYQEIPAPRRPAYSTAVALGYTGAP